MTERNEFEWYRHPEAEGFVSERLDEYVAAMPLAGKLAGAMLARTSSRLVDWLDHLVLVAGDLPRGQLADLGFEEEDVPLEPDTVAYHHPGAILPRILLRTGTGAQPGSTVAAAIQVEDVSHFLMANQGSVPIEGTLSSLYRRAKAGETDGRELWVVERRGHAGFVPVEMSPDYPQRYLQAFERWATRPRIFADDQEGMEHTLALARSLVADLGTDTDAWIAFEAERSYWQGRNRAGQLQSS